MSEQAELIREAALLLRTANALPMNGLTDDESGELLIATEELGRATDGMRALAAADINHRSRYSLGSEAMCRQYGYTKGSHLIEYLIRTSSAETARRIKLGTAIMPRTALDGSLLPPAQPVIAAAVESGDVGVEAASHLLRLAARTERTASEEDREHALTTLVEQATLVSCDLVAVQARQWAAVLDTDGIEPREEQLRARRGLWMGRESNGITPFTGALDPVSAGILTAIFADADQAANPRHLDDLYLTGTADSPGAPMDDRTPAQRNLDVLLGTVKAGLRASATETGGMRSTVSMSVHITLQDLERGTGVGWIDGVDEPISVESVRELICDGQYNKILLGNAGEVLYLSTNARFFDAAQRRGMAARDGGCVWKNCAAPARQCDAHHVVKWDKEGNGPTHIDNGVLLCAAHHHYLHASRFEIKMIEGKPFLKAPFWADPSGAWTPMGQARTVLPAGLRRNDPPGRDRRESGEPATSSSEKYPYPTERGVDTYKYPYPTEAVEIEYPYPTTAYPTSGPTEPETFPYPTERPDRGAQCAVASTTVSAPTSRSMASAVAVQADRAVTASTRSIRRLSRCVSGDPDKGHAPLQLCVSATTPGAVKSQCRACHTASLNSTVTAKRASLK